MKQVTSVSLYGEKKKPLVDLIAECQRIVTAGIGTAPGFEPYELPQVHATIIGLERRIGSPAYNFNFWNRRGRDVPMEFGGFLAYLRSCGCFPFDVQLGGFAQRNYPFTSRKTTPYERSFSIQGDKVVVLGWPIRGEAPAAVAPTTPEAWVQEARLYPPTLETIRHAAQGFGILHNFHHPATEVDNDLFFRIGLLQNPGALTPVVKNSVEHHVRTYLSSQTPLLVEIRLDDVCVASYEDNRLPLCSTKSYSLADSQVTGEFVVRLFE